MKKLLPLVAAAVILFTGSGCKKDKNEQDTAGCNSLPHNAAPATLAGNWASGYSSYTDIVDAYNGQVIGNAWQSGKFFKITADGKQAEFFYMAKGQYSNAATKATGTIYFDAGSTATSGSFTFHACWAHYKGRGSTTVDRDATETELANQLTRKYYYQIEDDWLRIEPNGPVNEYSSSFISVQ